MFIDALNPFSDFNAQIRRGGVRGVIGAVDELGDVATSIGGGAAKITGAGEFFGGQDFLDWWSQSSDDRNPLHIGKDAITAPTSVTGSLTEGIVQIGVGLLGVGKLLKLKKFSTLARGLTQGAVADAIFLDPVTDRLSNLVQNGPSWLQNPLFDFLAAKPGDGEAEGRFKNSLEGLLLGGTIATLAAGAKVWRAAARGNLAAAAEEVAGFKAPQTPEVIDLPSGGARLSRGAGDTKPVLTEVKAEAMAGADAGLRGDELRLFEFDTPQGKGGIRARLENDQIVVESMGKLDPETGRIQVVKDQQPVQDFAPRAERGRPSPAARAFSDEFKVGENGETIVDGAKIEFSLEGEDIVKLRTLQALKPGEGAGTRAMNKIVAAADQHGVNIELNASPFGDNTLTKEQLVKFYEGFGFQQVSPGSARMIRRAGGLSGDLPIDPAFQGAVGRDKLSIIGTELSAEFPTANEIVGFRLKSGKPASIPTTRLRQEVFASRGDAANEALAMADGKIQNAIPMGGFSEASTKAAEDLATAYRTNRSGQTIRRLEQAWIKTNRTNLGANKKAIGKQIASLAHILESAGKGSRKIMTLRANDALGLFKGSGTSGLSAVEDFADIDPVALRRAAGLVLQSLGQDVARYSIRITQGASDLTYVQMARAMDQMVHVEELVTGRPAVWLDRSNRLFKGGRPRNPDVQGTHANLDAPTPGPLDGPNPNAAKETAQAVSPVPEAAPKASAAAAAGVEEGAQLKIPRSAFQRLDAGVSPGPRSVRNLSKNEIQRLGRFVALADGDPRGILTSLKATKLEAMVGSDRPGIRSTLIRWRLSGMLSGFSTQAVNTISTGIQTALLPAELMIGGVLKNEPGSLRQGAHALYALLTEQGDAWRAVGRALKVKQGALDPAFMTREIDAGRFGGMLSFMNIPMDFLTASDEFFKVLNYRARIRSRSLLSSAREGLDAATSARRMADDLDASIAADGHGLNTDALEYARNATFTDDLGPKVKRIASLIQGDDALGTAGQLFIPFLRTPHNVMKNIVMRSPLAALSVKSLQADFLAGGARAASAQGRLATAAALTGTAGLLAAAGRITGGGPQNPAVRKRWMDAGFRPYTIRMGNTLVNYNRLSSLFGPMAMVADIWQASGSIKDGETINEAMMGVTASLLNYVSDNSWIGNAGEMMNVLFDGDPHAMVDFTERVAATMAVPVAVSQFTGFDDQMREADGFVQNLMKLTPGLSDNLPARRNIFREPVFKAAGSFDRTFNPFTQVGPTKDNALALSLYRLGKNMALPDHLKYDGRLDLRDTNRFGKVNGMSPYEFWQEKTAHPSANTPSLKSALSRLIHSTAWARMPPGSEDFPGGPRYEAAAAIIQQYQDLAEVQMLGAFPDLAQADMQEKILRSVGRFGGRPATDALQESFTRRQSSP